MNRTTDRRPAMKVLLHLSLLLLFNLGVGAKDVQRSDQGHQVGNRRLLADAGSSQLVSADVAQPSRLSCPDGKKAVQFKQDPCAYTLCAAGTTCEVDYCSGCTAVCRKPDNSSNDMPTHPLKDKPQHNSRGVDKVGRGTRRCKDSSKPINCLVDPCRTQTCAEGEVCESNYCGGCNAVCKVPAPTNSTPGVCADGSTPVNCLVDPCRTQKCAEGEVCESNCCGGCNAVCKAPAPTSDTPGTCADGGKPVNCLVDPCVAAACKEDEFCEADYCGGCKAVCHKVPVSPWVGPPSNCSDGSEPVKCFIDPCETKNCPEMCLRDYCDGCNATCKPFPPKNGRPDSSDTTNGTVVNTTAGGAHACPDGLRPVACFVDPCSTAKCGSGQVCESNYCGGCNAVCKVLVAPAGTNGTATNSTAAASSDTCSDGSKPVQCLMDPCIATTCLTGTVCEADYCGGCNAICKETAPTHDAPSSSDVCKDGSQPVKCLVNPCDTARCVAGTVCEPDYCEGCKAVCKKL